MPWSGSRQACSSSLRQRPWPRPQLHHLRQPLDDLAREPPFGHPDLAEAADG